MQQARTRRRTDPFPSTTILFYLWRRDEPKAPGRAPPGLCLAPVTRRLGSQTRTGRIVVVNSSFCSGSIISLVGTAYCNRVEHSDGVALPGRMGTHKGRPYRQSSLCNGVEHANGPIRFRQQLFLSTSGGVMSLRRQVERLQGCSFPRSRGGRFSREDRQISLSSTVLFILVRFFLWTGRRIATG